MNKREVRKQMWRGTTGVAVMLGAVMALATTARAEESWKVSPRAVPTEITIPPGPFKPEWKSLERYQAPDWFRDAKFGCFIHWGPQTLVTSGKADATDGGVHNWRDAFVAFTGAKFDAAHWTALFKEGGAKYVVQVIEHHDAYALYDSSYTKWSSVRQKPKRDFAAELSTAVRKAGLIYGASSHTEEHCWFYAEPPQKAPPAPQPGRPATGQPDKQFLDWWQARLVEMVEKYQPQVMWFDWCIEQPAYEPYLRNFAAYYYNQGAAWQKGVVLNYKYFAFPEKAAVLDISVGTGNRVAWKPADIRSVPWQFDTESSQAWFWRPNIQVRSTVSVIGELADIVSKNGNMLLNITPDPDGVIADGQDKLLREIGRWLARHGDAIYGTRPWKVFGEGPAEGLNPEFKRDRPVPPYSSEDFRFTAKGETVYAIGLAWPDSGQVTIKSLAAGSANRPGEIKSVRLLGCEAAVRWTRGPEGLKVELPSAKPETGIYALEVR